jgi:anaerobic selenocysteine-containing dehydrogenase
MVGLSRPVVAPQLDTMHSAEALLRLSAALGGSVAASLPWDSVETSLQAGLQTRWRALENEGYWIDDAYRPETWSTAFPTPSGKFDFSVSGVDLKALFGLPRPDGEEGSYNLKLIPFDSVRIATGAVGSPPFMIKTVSDTVLKEKALLVEVNPETANAAGFSEGDQALLTTPLGSAAVRVHITDGLMPGLVAIPRGLGHTAYSRFLAEKGVNANDLIGPVEDPASGLDAAWGILASLVKA